MTPTTLGELRAAVARVLVARGEAAEALRVDGTPDADGYGVRLWSSEYPAHDLRMTTWAATEAQACAPARGRRFAPTCTAKWRTHGATSGRWCVRWPTPHERSARRGAKGVGSGAGGGGVSAARQLPAQGDGAQLLSRAYTSA